MSRYGHLQKFNQQLVWNYHQAVIVTAWQLTASCLTVQWCLFLGCRSKQWSIIACCVTVQPCLWVVCSCVKLCCSDGILYKDVLASVKTSCVMGLFQNVLWAFAMVPFRHLWLHYKWTIWFVLRENKKKGEPE